MPFLRKDTLIPVFVLIFNVLWALLALSYFPAAWRAGDGLAMAGILAVMTFVVWRPFFEHYGRAGPILLAVVGLIAFIGMTFNALSSETLLLRFVGIVILLQVVVVAGAYIMEHRKVKLAAA